MTSTTATRLLIGLSCVLCFFAACAQASEGPAKSLPAHLAESGMPTEREVAMVEGWLKTIIAGQDAKASQAWFDGWIGARLPFSFRYDGREFTGTGAGWRFQAGEPQRQAGAETRDLIWLHAETGLKVTGRLRRFLDYPAVDSLLTFENTGSKDTALIENVRNLDLTLNQTQPGEKKTYTVRGCHGGRCGEDDLMPFTRTVTTAADGAKPTLTLLRQDYENLEIDRSVIQTPLTIGDRKFAHGLGTHSVSRIRIRSPKAIERLTAWVGVDHNERTRDGAGSVVFSVASEQGQLLRSKTLRGGQAPQRIDLDTRGAKTLDLNVDDAGDGPTCDHADWADAAITLQGGQTIRLDELARGDAASTQFGSQSLSSNQELPFFNVESPEGRGVLVGLGWSGSWRASFAVVGAELNARAGMPTTRFRLHPGEKVRGPRVLLVFWNGPRLHGSNMLRRVLYEHYLPHLPNGRPHEPLVSVNTCFTYHGKGGYLEAVTEKSLSALVDPFIALGAEAFVVDAGYFNCKNWWDINTTKDYSYSKKRFPHGFRSIANQLARAGVAFGFWFWAEIVGNMDAAQNRERFLAVVDDYVKQQGMTMYRQDISFEPDPGGPDRRGVAEMKHLAGLYAMQDELHRRYPFLVREGCCGGGRRIDLESLSHFLWHQKSDSWFHTVSDQSGLCGANLYLPGGVINVPTEATDNFGLWSSFAGQLCLAWHPLDKDFPMKLAKRQVQLYKRVRPLLSGDFYPLTECTLEKPWLAYQFHRTDLDRGFALIFKRKASQGDGFLFAPKGLEPQSRYAIDCQQSGLKATYTGAELAKGVRLTLRKTPAAELVNYEKQP
jgi:alpha-galactosidase